MAYASYVSWRALCSDPEFLIGSGVLDYSRVLSVVSSGVRSNLVVDRLDMAPSTEILGSSCQNRYRVRNARLSP